MPELTESLNILFNPPLLPQRQNLALKFKVETNKKKSGLQNQESILV